MVNNKLKLWIKIQWNESLAKYIWDDLTPLGRGTIWIPMLLICYLLACIIIPLAILYGILDDIITYFWRYISKVFFR